MSDIKGMLRVVCFAGSDEVADLAALCPACGFEHGFSVHDGKWTFNGNYERPTFSPSMGFNIHGTIKQFPRCHSFVRDGQWQYLSDCTHAMAGHTVDMIPPDPDMTFERRHGWHLYPWCDDDGQPLPECEACQ